MVVDTNCVKDTTQIWKLPYLEFSKDDDLFFTQTIKRESKTIPAFLKA